MIILYSSIPKLAASAINQPDDIFCLVYVVFKNLAKV